MLYQKGRYNLRPSGVTKYYLASFLFQAKNRKRRNSSQKIPFLRNHFFCPKTQYAINHLSFAGLKKTFSQQCDQMAKSF